MDSVNYTPGDLFFASDSPRRPWGVVLEDDGSTAYLYACDRSRATQDETILDAALIYNVAALQDREVSRLAAVEWSRDGMQAVLYLNGTAQALVDFAARETCCRSNFPNFLGEGTKGWRSESHAWDPAKVQQFEAALYA